jgi:hypothetical protein
MKKRRKGDFKPCNSVITPYYSVVKKVKKFI